MHNQRLRKANALLRNREYDSAVLMYRELMSINEALDAIVLWNLLFIENKKKSFEANKFKINDDYRLLNSKRLYIRLGSTRVALFETSKSIEGRLISQVSIEKYSSEMNLPIWKVTASQRLIMKKVDAFYATVNNKYEWMTTLWLIVHLAKVRTLIVFSENYFDSSTLNHSYYDQFLDHKIGRGFVLKAEPEIVCSSAVSFCIPSGGDTPELRRCVERILSFDLEKEVILCGDVPETFPFASRVRVVGRDIPFPPVRLSVKKNVAIDEARFPHICVLHDRVLLPVDFPSLFDNLIPIPVMALGGIFLIGENYEYVGRYSDFNVARPSLKLPKIDYLSNQEPFVSRAFTRDSRFLFSRSHSFYYCCDDAVGANSAYATGSFFLTSKSVYEHAKLDNSFLWEEFEDAQWGIRTNEKMIPHIFNTDYFHLTQSVRPTVLPTHSYIKSGYGDGEVIETFDIEVCENPVENSRNYFPNSWESLFLKRLEDFMDKYPQSEFSFYDLERTLKKNRESFLIEFEAMIVLIAPLEYSELFLRHLEKLLCITFEVTDVEDQKIRNSNFQSDFVFSSRILNNYSYTQWVKYFRIGLLQVRDDFCVRNGNDFATIVRRLTQLRRQLEKLNDIFQTKHSSVDWYLILNKFWFDSRD